MGCWNLLRRRHMDQSLELWPDNLIRFQAQRQDQHSSRDIVNIRAEKLSTSEPRNYQHSSREIVNIRAEKLSTFESRNRQHVIREIEDKHESQRAVENLRGQCWGRFKN
ncbi:hypothetical protein RRG08_032175 [Elysia crispata]|uniref:Uncharacterized protein n=1 Tax=Elysia crispata TaxID=231223 RepID=A0AAE1ADL0_9GAST|nr:hypothetical protein RRG08_032175 [Elysia crispata]